MHYGAVINTNVLQAVGTEPERATNCNIVPEMTAISLYLLT